MTRFNIDLAPARLSLHKFGFNANISTNFETVWDQGGIITYPAAATQMKVSSGSTDDDVGGTGALMVELFGLDSNYDEISEVITLTGRTAVLTTASFLRTFRMIVRSAGSGGENAGILYAGTGDITTGVPAVIHATVGATHNQSLMAVWTVPRKRIFHLLRTHFIVSDATNNQDVTGALVVRPQGEVFQFKQLWEQRHEHDVMISPRPGLQIDAKSDIEMRAKVDANTMAVSAKFSGLMTELAA